MIAAALHTARRAWRDSVRCRWSGFARMEFAHFQNRGAHMPSDLVGSTKDIGPQPPATRLQALGHERRSRAPLTQLDAKAKLLIEYQVVGCPHDWVSQYTRPAPTEFDPDARRPLEPGEPLRLEEAADALRIRRRYARWIMAQGIAQKELALQLNALRNGMKSRAMMTVGQIMEERGENSAADRKVQLQAAQFVLTDGESAKAGVNVHVTQTTNIKLRAGVVIRPRHNPPRAPLEIETDTLKPVTIEATPISRDDTSTPPSRDEISQIAARTFGSAADAWLNAPHARLGGQSPHGVARTEDGRARVARLIAEIATERGHGE